MLPICFLPHKVTSMLHQTYHIAMLPMCIGKNMKEGNAVSTRYSRGLRSFPSREYENPRIINAI